ncbi:putative repeat protein (TIGR01451 family)/fimbrial isopeptide formation D2 family protein, partial [Variovorax boronicumulans]|uniref:isopeptide-forming domain-containing fimbrial protein n=1 Tax=Variovorax boronicumulans TaxID=436515 RepID=UPI002783BFC9
MKNQTRSAAHIGGTVMWLVFVLMALISQGAWAQTVSNTATIAPPSGVVDTVGGCTSSSPPACSGNNTSTANVDVWSATTTKTASPASGIAVLPGGLVTYTVTVTVTGVATTAPVVLTDTLSANLSFGSIVSNTGGFTSNTASNPLTFTLPAGAAVGAHSIQYTAQVAANATGSVKNSVVGGGCTVSSPCTTTHPIGSLTLAKVLTAETGTQAGIAEAGETLSYTITITNTSGTAVTGYALSDVLSAGLTFVSADNGGVASGQTINWTGLTVPAGASLQVVVKATVNTPVTTADVRNLAKKTGDVDPTCPGTACVVTPTAGTVTVAKTANPVSGSTVVAGQTISYTLTATVSGGATTAATVLSDTLGTGLSFGTVTTPGIFVAGGTGNTRTFTLPTGTTAGTYSVTYTATVNAGATTGTVNNAVTGATCTTPGGCTTTHPVGNVTVSKVLTTETGTQAGIAEAGETLTYTITVANPSTTAVTGYALSDVLSAGLTFVSADNGGVASGQT